MEAMVFEKYGLPLKMVSLPMPQLKPGQLLLKVSACGVCRTDLHIIEGDLKEAKLPLVLGHEIVGTVAALAADENDKPSPFRIGERVGVPWLGQTCSDCRFCLSERENLCDHPSFTGYNLDGGYASHTVADRNYCFRLPDAISDQEAAPLLCAGLIGWRTLKLAGEGKRLGIYGFGAAAHIITQVALFQGREVYAFTRPGDLSGQDYARSLGAIWAGDCDRMPPQKLDTALIFAPAGELVPLALKASDKGASIVCGGIHMSDIPSFPYADLWQERSIKSVANLTRQDAVEFLEIAGRIPVRTKVNLYPLKEANLALSDLKHGRFHGAAVLTMPGPSL
ncbi:MAG: zinc-dependent alcohol dehydrogenase family protein [Candidatus Melainabacteria bacterium]|nr:zinc-dependent alcohol dehydrogenase family protein [Candidatus Melainabacteria bacterium]